MFSRIAQAVLCVGIAALVVGALLDGQGLNPLAVVIAVLVLAVGVVLAVRSYRMGALYGPDGIEVHGLLRNRRIAKEQITQITNFPAVRWESADGRSHWTPIVAFAGYGQLAFIHRYNQFCILRLQTWDDERRLKARRDPAKPRPRRRRR
jgi:hypothetical protein